MFSIFFTSIIFFASYNCKAAFIQFLRVLQQRLWAHDSFIPASSPWLVLLVLRDLYRLTRGGFAAGTSFSLMREMEQFLSYIHFHTHCVSVCGGVWVQSRLCLCTRTGSSWGFVFVVLCNCSCEISGVCLSRHVILCVALRSVCVWENVFYALHLHWLFQIFSSCETQETDCLCGCWTQHFIFAPWADAVD